MWLRLVLILGEIKIYFFILFATKVVQGYNKDILSVEKEGAAMFALQGYYDGNAVQTMEKIRAQKNQKLIITILDEFIEEIPVQREKKSARGLLEKYANPAMRDQEETAWEKAIVEKYENN